MERKNLIYPELCYELVGIAFKVYNQLGYGYQEKYYQRAYACELDKSKKLYRREVAVKIKYGDVLIGRYFLDFIVADKIIVELKIADDFKNKYIRQVLEYLNETNTKLAILVYFTRSGAKYRRIINSKVKIN